MTTKTNNKIVKKVEEKAPVKARAKKEVVVVEKDTAFEKFLDHQKKAFSEATKAFESLIPTAFKEHGEAAFKEVVEGYRQLFNSMLDQVVETIEKAKLESGKSMDDLAEVVEKAKLEPGKAADGAEKAKDELIKA